MRPGFQPIRQEVRHILTDRHTAGSAFQQRCGLCPCAAQQHAGSLRAVKSLVARHGNKRRPKAFQIQRQDACGLGRVNDKGDSPPPADLRNDLHRLHKAEHVGNMIADHSVQTGADQQVKGLSHRLRAEQRSACHGHIGLKRRQRSGDGIVLIAGDQHSSPAGNQTFDGNI